MQLAIAAGAKVFATASDDKRSIVEGAGAVAIDRYMPVEEFVAKHTRGAGFDIVYDTLGGSVLDTSFAAASATPATWSAALEWGSHSLAPLSFRSATYSGVFKLFTLLGYAPRTSRADSGVGGQAAE